jgi:hypothetical protein
VDSLEAELRNVLRKAEAGKIPDEDDWKTRLFFDRTKLDKDQIFITPLCSSASDICCAAVKDLQSWTFLLQICSLASAVLAVLKPAIELFRQGNKYYATIFRSCKEALSRDDGSTAKQLEPADARGQAARAPRVWVGLIS